ncbi:MAG: replication-associated recombination protein A [Mariprofundaceae bacterium]|nr:replication-associated recombination protein A [Mariprofundaceae bacterium]
MPGIFEDDLKHPDLFHDDLHPSHGVDTPLAHCLRPVCLDEVAGQPELTVPDSWFSHLLAEGRAASCIFWGPPGVGKTTLAHMMARSASIPFEHLSAVSAGKAEVQMVVNRAKSEGRSYLLFLDEIHRFNKAQQDVLLPYIEDGTLLLVGATTENPSFALNNALLSRCRVIVLKALDTSALENILARGLAMLQQGSPDFDLETEALKWIASTSNGDARYALNAMESLYMAVRDKRWALSDVQDHWSRRVAQYDRDGDFHYDIISALHKCVRDSDADAACYWLARMLEAGEEPLYIARRLIRMATEDVGLSDPNALTVSLNAQRMFEILGSPEGEQGLFEAVIYLALAPKSNAAYMAEKGARKLARKTQDMPVPMHLRNAPTKLMKELGHGADYQYAHHAPDAMVAQQHFPDGMGKTDLYVPTDRGFEHKLGERMRWLEERKEDMKK